MNSRRAYVVWVVGLLAYAVAVFHRASLGVAAVDAQERFSAGASAVSLFLVLQLAVYAGLQVPVGIALDRFGSRTMVAAGALTMAAGQLLLAHATDVPTAIAARVLVGAGDAMTFISVLRVVTLWFSGPTVPVITQLTGILGQLGQIAAAYPLVLALHHTSWTATFTGAAALGVLVVVLVVAALRTPRPAPRWRRWPAGPRSGRTWPAPGTSRAPGSGSTPTWSPSSPAPCSRCCGATRSWCWARGCPPAPRPGCSPCWSWWAWGSARLLGALCGRWPLRRSALVFGISGATITAWTVVLLWPGRAPLWLLVVLVVVLATNGPGSMIGFDYARTWNPVHRLGSATGVVNIGGFVASLLTVLAVGAVLDALTPGASTDYDLGAFKAAFAVQYLFWAIGLAGVLTHRRRLRDRLAGRRRRPHPAVHRDGQPDARR